MYHGTKTQLEPGAMLTPDGSAEHRDHLSHGYVFATDHLHLARVYGNGQPGGATATGYVYEVQACGELEQDPAEQVAGSYRTRQPLRVLRLVEISHRPGRWEPACGRHEIHFAWGC